MKTISYWSKKTLPLLIIYIACSQLLLAQKSSIDPYLKLLYNTKFIDEGEDVGKFSSLKAKNANLSSFKRMGINISLQDPRIEVIMEFQGDVNLLKKMGVNVRSKVANYITADLPLSLVQQLEVVPEIKRIELAKTLKSEMDESGKMINLDKARQDYQYRGAGVIIGIIDSGIDVNHPAFKTADGSMTRIKALWDQTSLVVDPPVGYDYGKEWAQNEINNGNITQTDVTGHGTHVAAIVAGNGKNGGGIQTEYMGMAPESDLIIVKTRTRQSETYNYPSFTNASRVIDGIMFVANKAKALNKPWIVNLSLGSEVGPRNGTSLFERMVSEIVNNYALGKGRIIVKSAGNNGYKPGDPTTKTHAEGPSSSASVRLCF